MSDSIERRKTRGAVSVSVSVPGQWTRHCVEAIERRVMLSGNVLAFTAVPTTTNAGAIIDSPAGVQVTVENSSGQPVTSDIDSITISIGSNPGGATLGGTVTAAAVGGVATFNNLWIGAPSNGYTLVATDTSFTAVTPATSSAFNIDALPLFDPLVSMTHGVAGA